MTRSLLVKLAAVFLASVPILNADTLLENDAVKIAIGGDGVLKEFVDKAARTDYAYREKPMPFCSIRANEGKESRDEPASAITFADGVMNVLFQNSPVTAKINVKIEPARMVFTVAEISDKTVYCLSFVDLMLNLSGGLGAKLCLSRNDKFFADLLAANLQTECRAWGDAKTQESWYESVVRHEPAKQPDDTTGRWSRLTARSYAQFGHAGAQVVLIAGNSDEANIKRAIRQVAVDFGLPHPEIDGVSIKDYIENRKSYFFVTSTREAELDETIEYARAMGMGGILFGMGTIVKSTGHYEVRQDCWPRGAESIRDMLKKVHDAGMLAGIHIFCSKISKSDPFVTPVPDKRFWKDRETTLAEDVDETATSVKATDDLYGWPGSGIKRSYEGDEWKHCDIIIDDEIIRYDNAEKGPSSTFTGCRRGAYGTKAASHKRGAKLFHFGVDGCINGYIIDQETGLLDEAQTHAATLYNFGFDFCYFDGGEDTPTPLWHYVPNFEIEAWKKFRPFPRVFMGTICTHHSWHIFSRNSTVDIRTEHVREHVDKSVAYLMRSRSDLLPGELGWFGLWPKEKDNPGLQIDEIEYLMCKAIAYDAPISIETSIRNIREHTLSEEIMRIIKQYETLRIGKYFTAEQLQPLRNPTQDILRDGKICKVGDVPEGHVLLKDDMEYQFLKIEKSDRETIRKLREEDERLRKLKAEQRDKFKEPKEKNAAIRGLSSSDFRFLDDGERHYRLLAAAEMPPNSAIVRDIEEGDLKARCINADMLPSDFTLVKDGDRWRFVRVWSMSSVGGDPNVRAAVGQTDDGRVIANLWHIWNGGTLSLNLRDAEIEFRDFEGNAVEFKRQGGAVELPVVNKRYALVCRKLALDQLIASLRSAKVSSAPPVKIWRQAEKSARIVGEMATGEKLGIKDEGARGDFIACGGAPDSKVCQEWFAEYTVDLPRKGTYIFWGRFRHPVEGGFSFGLVPADAAPMAYRSKPFSNSKMGGTEWHWNSSAGADVSPLGSVPLKHNILKPGPFTFRVYAREGTGNPKTNPRLDMIFITDDPEVTPMDRDIPQD